jgi:hypothetical protein
VVLEKGHNGVSSAFGFELSIQTNSKFKRRKRKALPVCRSHLAGVAHG